MLRLVNRPLLLLLSAIAATLALAVQRSNSFPQQVEYLVEQNVTCALVPRVIPLAAIQATVAEQRFRALVGVDVRVHTGRRDDHHFGLVASDANLEIAKKGLDQSRQLLSAEVERLAMGEIKANREHIATLEREVATQIKRRQQKGERAEKDQGFQSLSKKESERVFLLRREVKQLESFLGGGTPAGWIYASLDRSALERQQRRVADAESILAELKQTWTPHSREAKAQNEVVVREKAELLAIERHLAEALLDSHRAELAALDAKSMSLIAQGAALSTTSPSEAEPKEANKTGATDWMKAKTKDLDAQAKRIKQDAAVVPLGSLEIEQQEPLGYWLTTLFWSLSLAFLIGGLSLPERLPPATPALRNRSTRGVREPEKPKSPPPQATSVPEQDDLFAGLCQKIEHELGRPLQRLIVLGRSGGQDRSSVTLRLAKSYSNANFKVRLIDFDLRGGELSRRIGDASTPGVGDLLAEGGPVDEFFASIAGTKIQFAPAGRTPTLGDGVCTKTLEELLAVRDGTLLIVDAGFSSPLHLVVGRMDAVLCLTQPRQNWSQTEQQVLLALRDSKLPLWGVSQGTQSVFPLL